MGVARVATCVARGGGKALEMILTGARITRYAAHAVHAAGDPAQGAVERRAELQLLQDQVDLLRDRRGRQLGGGGHGVGDRAGGLEGVGQEQRPALDLLGELRPAALDPWKRQPFRPSACPRG